MFSGVNGLCYVSEFKALRPGQAYVNETIIFFFETTRSCNLYLRTFARKFSTR